MIIVKPAYQRGCLVAPQAPPTATPPAGRELRPKPHSDEDARAVLGCSSAPESEDKRRSDATVASPTENAARALGATARSTQTAKIGPSFVADTFVCKAVPPVAGANGVVTFDDHFIPPESGGEWFVDDLRGQQGEAAIHPPTLDAMGEASMTFACSDSSSTVSFSALRRGAGDLEFFDGKKSRGIVPAIVDGFGVQTFDVDSPQDLRLVARNTTAESIASPFAVDTFSCK